MIEPSDLRISWAALQTSDEDPPGMQFWHGDVHFLNYLTEDDDEEGTELTIGHVCAVVADLPRVRYGLYDACDTESANLELIAGEVVGDDLALDLDFLGINPWDSVLLLDTIELNPEYRGQDLGVAVAKMAVAFIGAGCSIALAYPAPMGDPANGRSHDEAITALGQHWAKAGFQQLHRDTEKLGVWAMRPEDVEIYTGPREGRSS